MTPIRVGLLRHCLICLQCLRAMHALWKGKLGVSRGSDYFGGFLQTCVPNKFCLVCSALWDFCSIMWIAVMSCHVEYTWYNSGLIFTGPNAWMCFQHYPCHINWIFNFAVYIFLSIFPIMPLGVLAHRLRTLDCSLVPPSTWAEIFRRTFLQSHLQTSLQTKQNSYPKLWNPRTTFENTPLCLPKYSIVRGVGGVPDDFFGWNPSIFVS